MAEAADRLFWFAGGPGDQYIVSATSMDEAKRKMADFKLSYDRCAPLQGPDDGMPPGVWNLLDDAT